MSNPLAEAFPETAELLAELRTGAWLDRQEFPPLDYAVPGILPEGLSLLIGAPKIGKSWKVLQYALAVASGGYALSAIPVGAPRPVFYLALEDGDRRMQDRCRRLLDSEPIPHRLEYMTRVESGQVIPTLQAWLALRPDARPLVIVDTLGKVMPPAVMGESAYQRDYRVGSTLKRLCDERPGMSLLINHHDRKANSEDFVDSVSGTHGLAGSADTILVIARDRSDENGLLKITGRDVPEGEYALRFVDGSAWTLDGADLTEAARNAATNKAVAGLGDRSAEVYAFAADKADGVRAKDVAAALDMDQPTARTYLYRLADSGRLRRVQRGLYAPVMSVASVISPGEDADETQHLALDVLRSDGADGETQHPVIGLSRSPGAVPSENDTYNTRNSHTRACRVCGEPLDPALGDVITHPNCSQNGDTP